MASFQTVYVPVDASEAREIKDLIRAQQQFLLWGGSGLATAQRQD
jgi:hypothetical protein